jgi:hypothetical protein
MAILKLKFEMDDYPARNRIREDWGGYFKLVNRLRYSDL